MKHTTCDKCGNPMDNAAPMRIQDYLYDICSICHNEILNGLDSKGVRIISPPDGMFKDKLREYKEYKGL